MRQVLSIMSICGNNNIWAPLDQAMSPARPPCVWSAERWSAPSPTAARANSTDNQGRRQMLKNISPNSGVGCMNSKVREI